MDFQSIVYLVMFFKTKVGMSNVDQPLKILIVDDDEDDYFITSDLCSAVHSRLRRAYLRHRVWRRSSERGRIL